MNMKKIQGKGVTTEKVCSERELPIKSESGDLVAPKDMNSPEIIDTLDLHCEFVESELCLLENAFQSQDARSWGANKFIPVVMECRDRLELIETLSDELFNRIPKEKPVSGKPGATAK
jgi:hypothetical protein